MMQQQMLNPNANSASRTQPTSRPHSTEKLEEKVNPQEKFSENLTTPNIEKFDKFAEHK